MSSHSSPWMRSRAFGSHLHAYVRLEVREKGLVGPIGGRRRAICCTEPGARSEKRRTGREGVGEKLSSIHGREQKKELILMKFVGLGRRWWSGRESRPTSSPTTRAMAEKIPSCFTLIGHPCVVSIDVIPSHDRVSENNSRERVETAAYNTEKIQ